MKTKLLPFLIISVLTLFGCGDKEIDGTLVNKNPLVYAYTYKADNSPVTGTITFYKIDSISQIKYCAATRIVANGICHSGTDYYVNGKIMRKFTCNSIGCVAYQEAYDETGRLGNKQTFTYETNATIPQTCEAKVYDHNGTAYIIKINYNPDGSRIEHVYAPNGITQLSELHYNKDGQLLKEYKFDSKGEKIIPLTDKLQLVKYRTGFFDFSTPIFIAKWKNISGETISELIKMRVAFYLGEEVISQSYTYITSSNEPLEQDMTTQVSVDSSVFYLLMVSGIKCKVYLVDGDNNEIAIGTYPIQEVYLYSHRL